MWPWDLQVELQLQQVVLPHKHSHNKRADVLTVCDVGFIRKIKSTAGSEVKTGGYSTIGYKCPGNSQET